MNRKEIRREIALLELRLESNSRAMRVGSLKELEHSPVVQRHLGLLIGGALAGGFTAGFLTRRVKVPLAALMPYVFKF